MKKKEVENVFKSGKRVSFNYITVVFLKNSIGIPRFAFLAPKKVFKKSTKRNRVKRLLREALRLLYHRFENLNCDIILIGKSDLLNLKVYDLEKEIESISNFLEREC
ncbi:MAG: ribonuclease P protein component [Sulfurihydrogenibium sp.]|nr:MAG: ribonuclease P protein component [Sulfurihydrogenibium sp.]PMP76961.1 MAG: ribonuclease P protein component [Sulfurihydrogenibium sp.]